MKKLLFIVFALIWNVTWAQIPKPQKDTYVNDFAHVLSKADIDDLNLKIAEIEKASGIQLAIVLVDKIPARYDIQRFSAAIGQEWQVGDEQRGLVYVAAIKQHQQRIEVARNLDSVFTSEKCAGILEAMKPWFRNKDYAGGLELLVGQIADANNTPAAAPKADTKPVGNVQEPAAAPKHEDSWLITFLAILAVLVVFAIGIGLIWLLFSMIRTQYGAKGNRSSTPGYTSGPGSYTHSQGSGVGGFVAGAAFGAAAAYAAEKIHDDLSNRGDITYDDDDSGSDDSSSSYSNSSSDDDDSSSGSSDSSGDSSSYDSGFSDSGSSDSGSSDSGATSDW